MSTAAPIRSIDDLPHPPGLPLLGNAHQLVRSSKLHLRAEEWSRRYGPIARIDIGRRRLVGISDPDEIHRILREVTECFGFTMVPKGLRVRLRDRLPEKPIAAGAGA